MRNVIQQITLSILFFFSLNYAKAQNSDDVLYRSLRQSVSISPLNLQSKPEPTTNNNDYTSFRSSHKGVAQITRRGDGAISSEVIDIFDIIEIKKQIDAETEEEEIPTNQINPEIITSKKNTAIDIRTGRTDETENRIEQRSFKKENLALHIYPNPSSGYITISNIETASIQLVTISGQLLYNNSFINTEQVQLDLTVYPVSIYILHVLKNGQKKTYKIIRQ